LGPAPKGAARVTPTNLRKLPLSAEAAYVVPVRGGASSIMESVANEKQTELRGF